LIGVANSTLLIARIRNKRVVIRGLFDVSENPNTLIPVLGRTARGLLLRLVND